jgi:16S rRNA (adenine1518-N6/adenine1519-N6)-dimethyltransferase
MRGYKPRKSLGQHFLINDKKLWQIVQLARLSEQDTVVEIGAGRGNLTKRLARRAGMVYAIEFDKNMEELLARNVPLENVRIMMENALFFDYQGLAEAGKKLKVVANLPYNISTQLIFKLLENADLFSMLLLMVQREVGLRLVAEPGTRDYGILSIFTQLRGKARIVMELGPQAFRPRPKVHSTLVRIDILDRPREELADHDFFRKVVRAAFSKRRKTLRNSLSKSELDYAPDEVSGYLHSCGIDPQRRAETLSLTEFANLANFLYKRKHGKDE